VRLRRHSCNGGSYRPIRSSLAWKSNFTGSISRHPFPAQRWHKSPSGVSRCQPLRTRAPQREQMPRTVGGPDPQTGSPLDPRPNFCRRRRHHPLIRANSIACIITEKLLFSRCGSKPPARLPHFAFHCFQVLKLTCHAS
jgi:hypothetical protein